MNSTCAVLGFVWFIWNHSLSEVVKWIVHEAHEFLLLGAHVTLPEGIFLLWLRVNR